MLSVRLRSDDALTVFSKPGLLSDFREAMRQSLAAGTGSFFDKVLPEDVLLEEHAGGDRKSLIVIGTVTPKNFDSVASIRRRLKDNLSTDKIRHMVVMQAEKLKGLSGVSVSEVKLLGQVAGDDARTWHSMINGAVRHMEFGPPPSPGLKSKVLEDEPPGEKVLEPPGEEVLEQETVSGFMIVKGVDYVRLREDAERESAFKDAVKESLASIAGGDVQPEDVEVKLSAGSVQVRSSIFCGSSCDSLRSKLESQSKPLSELILLKVSEVDGIDDATTGTLSISGLRFSPEEEEEEKEEWSPEDIGVAELLIGTVAAVMFIFYLVNWRDDTIRRYSWAITSTTVCIFISVPLFNCIIASVHLLIGGAPLPVHVVVGILLVIGLFATIQAIAGVMSGALCSSSSGSLEEEVWVIDDPTHIGRGTRMQSDQLRSLVLDEGSRSGAHKNVGYDGGCEVFASKAATEEDDRTVRMSCYMSLLTFTTAFAIMDAVGTWQQIEFFSAKLGMAALPAVATQALMFCFFSLCRVLRRLRRKQAEPSGPEVLWESESNQSESDIVSLSASFLIVQLLRFSTSGVLPDKTGIERPERPHSLGYVMSLYAAGLIAVSISILMQHPSLLRKTKPTDSSELLYYVSRTIQQTCSMICAWCLIFGMRGMAMRIKKMKDWGINPGTMAWQLALATATTIVTFVSVFILRRIQQSAPQKADILLHSVFTTFSLLVGLNWQRVFALALRRACSTSPRPALMEVAVSLAVVVIVAPAWRMYILTKVYRHQMQLQKSRQALQRDCGGIPRDSRDSSDSEDPMLPRPDRLSSRSLSAIVPLAEE